MRLPGSEAPQRGAAAQVTGLLLRSRAVSGWPDLWCGLPREVGNDENIIRSPIPTG